ncbi:DUF2889 domain-containing protein [Elioraea sp. Yellowstone]|jgi:hypothetical protein|uniref:DUF2889 domain-containing protein n=1 Tax=Elioraea sp. Yellowstone TaxID=2592070 RepID=UPI001153C40E|nr:DUF2889 domain-containing protein [Elioraea sp. Yellowstone]TQF77751.1 DUF2889 domain-containing protein [Elioraea sp. Yellowstone]
MPLSPPAEREKLHERTIVLEGFRRADGLFDIEARLTDTKTYAFANEDRGEVRPGEPLHGMLMRLTIDAEMTVVACEAVTEHGPYAICPAITPNFAALAGLRIGPGWMRAVKERVGGVKGCTHLVELLGPMATVAFQTTVVLRRNRPADPAKPPALLNTCHAYAADGPIVARRWPQFAKPRGEAAAGDAGTDAVLETAGRRTRL